VLLGITLQIAIIVVVPFILLGQVPGRCGGSEFFTDLARAWMGRYLSGSAVANVSAVGVVTIPLMKRSGFPAQIAAAIEAVGPTGGQLMPPVICRDADERALCALPPARLNSGSSEIRNWIVVAGAAARLHTRWQEYVPFYRTPAGTGCGMAFAAWGE